MLDDRVRRRIEALNRGPLPAGQPATMESTRKPTKKSPARPGCVPSLPGLLARGAADQNEIGEHWRIKIPLEDLWPGGAALVAARIAACKEVAAESARDREPRGAAPAQGLRPLRAPEDAPATAKSRADLNQLIAAYPQNLLLLDLETCGFAGAALFLVGILRAVDDNLTVELLLARDYSEEPAVLRTLWNMIDNSTVLATFNGKSFDWPMVLDRTARHLLFQGCEQPRPGHIDLLHHARRRWKGTLPDCRLQTIESRICGRGRTGDIPGDQIPGAYQQFVRTGVSREIDSILMHNAIDLVTLLDIAMRLAD